MHRLTMTRGGNAGHVRFLDAERVVVLGHRDANLAILDVKTGKLVATAARGSMPH